MSLHDEGDPSLADPDVRKGHGLLQQRWPRLEARLAELGVRVLVIECYRPEMRQQFLWGAGRTVAQLLDKGIPGRWARPNLKRVTNAWSARVSAHGHAEGNQPAAAALDICPVGKDGRAWTTDDEWTPLVAIIAREGPGFGLVHFHAPGKAVWDRPHLQLSEWCDRCHDVHMDLQCPRLN